MKLLFTLVGIFIVLPSVSQNQQEFSWEKLINKTWRAEDAGFGSRLVFYKSNIGMKKCIMQFEGSGVYIASTTEFSVEVFDGKINLSNPVKFHDGLKESDHDTNSSISLVIDAKNQVIINENSNVTYQILFKRPILLSRFGHEISIGKAERGELSASDFNK